MYFIEEKDRPCSVFTKALSGAINDLSYISNASGHCGEGLKGLRRRLGEDPRKRGLA
jgi:hypothetical protein